MSFIFKILATMASIITTIFVTVESARAGLLIASAIFGVAKIIVILLFSGLLLVILYLLLTSSKASPTK